MSKIKNGGLDQYGAEPFEQQQFGTAGVEGVKTEMSVKHISIVTRTHTVVDELFHVQNDCCVDEPKFKPFHANSVD